LSRGEGVPCIELVPGAPLRAAPKKKDEGPPEGFVDNVVYRYRLDENGNKVLIGTMPAFPEGWNIPKEFKKGEGKMSKDKRNPGPKREDREQIMKRVRQMIAEGTSVRKAAKLLDVPESTIYAWLAKERKKAQKQTPDPTSAQVGSQEPKQEAQEPANQSVAQEKPEITVRKQGFGPEDEEPIPYWPVDLRDLIAELRDDLDLERKKVANLEKKMDLLTSALSAVASVKATSPETRLAKLLVAVFREMEASASA